MKFVPPYTDLLDEQNPGPMTADVASSVELLQQQQGRMVPALPEYPTPPAGEGAEAGAVLRTATSKPGCSSR